MQNVQLYTVQYLNESNVWATVIYTTGEECHDFTLQKGFNYMKRGWETYGIPGRLLDAAGNLVADTTNLPPPRHWTQARIILRAITDMEADHGLR